MSKANRMRRKYTKNQMGKLMSGNLVGENETKAFGDKARAAGQAGLQAQTSMLNRASAANRAGSPVLAGALKDTAKSVATQSADVAVKAVGQGQQFAEALKEQRKGQILGMANVQIAQDRADQATAFDVATMAGSMGSEIGTGSGTGSVP